MRGWRDFANGFVAKEDTPNFKALRPEWPYHAITQTQMIWIQIWLVYHWNDQNIVEWDPNYQIVIVISLIMTSPVVPTGTTVGPQMAQGHAQFLNAGLVRVGS